MARVRPFTPDDLPEVIDLNTKLFPGSAGLSDDVQRNRFTDVCFHNPWGTGDIGSLVYENDAGKVSGFLGVVPRELTFNDETVRVAVGQHLMVHQAPLGSLQLFKAFMEGPQDFTMADMSVDITRRIWERLGGSTAHLYSIYWLYPLRPLSFFSSFAAGRRKAKGESGSSLSRFFDDMIAHNRLNPFRLAVSPYSAEDLTAELFVAHIDRFTSDAALRPSYTTSSIAWLFNILAVEDRFGPLRKVALRSPDGSIAGWYIYHAKNGGRGEVLQICSLRGKVEGVIDHLFHDAWEHGCVELSGRLNPRFMKEFGERRCLFLPGKNWMLVSSYRREILNAVFSGDAYLTRLEGDLWFF